MLKHLTFSSGPFFGNADANPLWDLIERCQPPLIRLELKDVDVEEMIQRAVIEGLPHLRILSLDLRTQPSRISRDHLTRIMERAGGQFIVEYGGYYDDEEDEGLDEG